MLGPARSRQWSQHFSAPRFARLLHLGLWHLRSRQGRGHMAPLCLDRCWATFPSPQGPSGSVGAAETWMCRLQQETSVHLTAPS